MAGQPPIRTIASRVVYENKWMVVREDDIERHDGEPGIFGVVEKPDFALVIPFDGDGFYVVEQYRYPVAGRYIEFPQGSWEDSPGADTTELARGELAEETGLRAGSITRLGHLYQAYGYSNQGFHVFLATNLTSGEQTLSVSERDAAAACRREEALGRLVSTRTLHAMRAIPDLRPEARAALIPICRRCRFRRAKQ